MLFMADRYLSDSPSQTFVHEAQVDKSIIRIQSAHHWPEPIVFDTRPPTTIPSLSHVLADAPMNPQEAFAQLKGTSEQVLQHSGSDKPKRKVTRRVASTRMAAYRTSPAAFPPGW